MVRRRGIYEVNVLGKSLTCLFCQGNQFRHREVYMDLQPLGQKVTNQLTFQSLTCTSCGDNRMFQEKEILHQTSEKQVSSIEYTEVIQE
ncbi:hypothetical protein [Sporosarcina luteola]|uniref:hypothetical protein n=1 Tax=Sporosarcina luteola TaxID=582850 RepID=UPI00203E017C|nr:hypothetical protein [Sporosarcina luteola]MCM3711465.1 hypothetical protein [Sporosarcina luteola]